MALEFRGLEEERKYLYSKVPSELTSFRSDDVKLDDDISLDDLVKAFMEFQKRKYYEKPLETVVTEKNILLVRGVMILCIG